MTTTVALPLKVAATATATATLVKGRHTPVDATTGALTMTLPTGAAEGVKISVAKVDATANAVTVSGSINGVTGTVTLRTQRESVDFVADSSGSWRLQAAARTNYPRHGQSNSWHRTDLRDLLVPKNAPLPRPVASSPPTITVSTSAPSGVRYDFVPSPATTPVGNKRMTPVAGTMWTPTSGGAVSAWANQNNNGTAIIHSPAAVLVGTDALAVTFMVKSNGFHRYRFKVDDEYLTSDYLDVAGPGGATTQYITLTFGAVKDRRIRFEQVNGFFYGVYVGANDTPPWAVKPRGPKVLVIADSYLAGDDTPPNGYTAFTGALSQMADHLGWDDVTNAAIAGTGWLVRTSGNTDSVQDRIATLVGADSWDAVIFAMGHNDLTGPTTAAVTAEVTSALDITRAALPDVPIIMFGPFFAAAPVAGTADPAWSGLQAAIFAGVLPAHRVITIDTVSAAIFTGTAKQGVGGTGNGGIYIQNETVATHPIQAGADYLGRRMTQMLLTALAQV